MTVHNAYPTGLAGLSQLHTSKRKAYNRKIFRVLNKGEAEEVGESPLIIIMSCGLTIVGLYVLAICTNVQADNFVGSP